MSRGKGKQGKNTCHSTGNHLMSPFEITRTKIKKKQKTITVTSGIRCKWCKKAEGRFKKEITIS